MRMRKGVGEMTTDNRTNEPTEAMLDAAGEAYDDHWEGGVWGDEFGERTCQFCGHLYQTAEERKNQANTGSDLMRARSRHSLRAALVAAAGAAPQAGSGSITGAVVRTASGPCHIIYTAEGMSEEHKPGCGHKPILQPSSTVDEVVK